jgi:hypothetical protein
METIRALWDATYNWFAMWTWYYPLYWLVFLGYPLLYIGAAAFSQLFLPLRRSDPVEATVHRVWGTLFLFHLLILLLASTDKIPATFYAGRDSVSGAEIWSSGVLILWGVLRVLVYVFFAAADLGLGFMLLRPVKYARAYVPPAGR